MTGDQKDLVRYRMERAFETWQEARLMLEHGHLHGAANRIYYACFYATVALLLTKGLSSPKHNGVMALFNRHFVKPKEEDIRADLEQAQEFIARIESQLGSM